MSVTGLLLAAGAGRRMGGPKALVRDAEGVPWSVAAIRTLRAGGCDDVLVVVGARTAEVRELLADQPAELVEATDWDEGMGASLRAGLGALLQQSADCALVHLVDLPDVGAEAVARLLADADPDSLARATYAGRPGHPVLIGREHWAAIVEQTAGDEGARDYLLAHHVRGVDCSDLADGHDVDYRRGMSDPTSEFSAVDKGTPLHPIDEEVQETTQDVRPAEVTDPPVAGVRAEGAPTEDPIRTLDTERLAGPRNDEDEADMSGDDQARAADQ